MQEEYLKLAIELAAGNVKETGGGPFGCVIAKEGKIIAAEANSVTLTNDPTAHAEVNAIRKACRVLGTFQLEGCELYASCEPCPMCLGAIYWARIQIVYYAARQHDAAEAGFDDSFIYREIELPGPHRTIPCVHAGIPESLIPFRIWKELENKTQY